MGVVSGRWTPAQRLTAALLTLAVAFGLLATLLALLSPLAPPPGDLSEATKVLVCNPEDLAPEPLERFLYVSGVFLLPFCLAAAHLGVRRLLATERASRALALLAPWTERLFIPFAFLLLFAGGAAEPGSLKIFLPGGTVSLLAAAALALAATLPAAEPLRRRAAPLLAVVAKAAVAVLLLGMLAFAVFDKEHVRNEPIFWASFNSMFHSVVQVYFGRELTVNLTNIYGFYPHFLEPFFRLAGLSVLSYTLAMGLLNCLAFALLYLFIARETRDRLLPFLGLASAVFFCYASGRVREPDQYFQYHPLRMIFPVVALLAVQTLGAGWGPWSAVGIGALGAAASLWNPDSGFVVLAASLLLLGYDALLRRRPRELLSRTLLAAAGAAAFVAAFSLCLRLRFGAFPDYLQLLKYPQAFYVYGSFMRPMPLFGLWVPVLALYAAALLHALRALIDGESVRRPRLTFFLSVLGLGLFTYYQGRSVTGNLVTAAYPAMLLLVLFADDLRREVSATGRAQARALLTAILMLLFFSVPAIATISRRWVLIIGQKVEVTRRRRVGEVLRDALFLQQHIRPGEKVLMMSYQSGLMHLLTRTTCPLDIPGASEIGYRSDFSTYVDYALAGRGKVAVDRLTIKSPFMETLRRRFPVRIEDPHGNFTIFPGH